MEVTIALVVQKYHDYKLYLKPTKQHVIIPPSLDKSFLWAFLDGGSQGTPPLEGVGGVIFLI